MKKINIAYWIVTILFAAFMLISAIPDVLSLPDAVTIMTHLGYPKYFTPFIGVAKVLGAIAILIPGFPKIKEWAYAGLLFDLTGATYSMMSVGDQGWAFMIIILAFAFAAYILYSVRQKRRAMPSV